MVVFKLSIPWSGEIQTTLISNFSIQRHSSYTRTSLTAPSLPALFFLEKIWWEYDWLAEGKGTAIFLRTECGRILVWPLFRRLCCYFFLKAVIPQIWLFFVREKGLFTEWPELLPAASHSFWPTTTKACIILLFILCRAVNARWMCLGGRVLVQTAPPAKSALLISRGTVFWNVSIKNKQQLVQKCS